MADLSQVQSFSPANLMSEPVVKRQQRQQQTSLQPINPSDNILSNIAELLL